ncbi:MAG: DNA methyltransferase [Deltaproteobacteria bacterium]|nr:DNA methyltransferase [Deltaproteobacteria bacterium]
MAGKKNTVGRKGKTRSARSYGHPEAGALLRPDIGMQAQFRKKKPLATYRYDTSLSPALEWDGQNSGREEGEAKIASLEDRIARLSAIVDPVNGDLSERDVARAKEELAAAREDATALKTLSKPFLNWAGKAERLSFDVPTLPLFVHERLSTSAILETLKGHTRDRQVNMFDLFGESDLPIHDRLLRAYEHQNGWVNRLILGDSLVVMNSLLGYEGVGGQVQTIYMDPPYAVKFGSNFQPFVRKRDVTHGDDEHMVREPEMVQAYRDTWELGLHSFLTYLRDRLLLARELLHPSGSIFVQMSDTNLHHVREVMDEVFGAECFVSQISFQTTSGFQTKTLATLGDFILWYARDPERLKVRKLFEEQPVVLGEGNARWVLLPDGSYRGVTAAERRGEAAVPTESRLYSPSGMESPGSPSQPQPFDFQGRKFEPNHNRHWAANYPIGLERLARAGRIHVAANSLRYRRFPSDFPYKTLGNIWTDTMTGSFTETKSYVVQTNPKVIERCLLMTSDPGDLVFDPTCGSGTTAYCAEKWGRRWITTDTSRVPLALARQRLLTSTFEFYQLKELGRGPAGGFEYRRRQNAKGEEVGGIVPHITLESIANDEPAKEEVLVDRPETDAGVTRVSGPFCVEATIPTPVDWEGDGKEDSGDASAAKAYASHVNRMIAVLQHSPVLRLGGGQTVTLSKVRLPARTMSLSAEASVEGYGEQTAAIVFGPENGAVSELLVFEAAREAYAKGYGHLYVIGFAIQPDARRLIEGCEQTVGVPATYVQASMDLLMGNLLKNLRSSQIFSVCGLPDVRIRKSAKQGYQVELRGLDVFDPVAMDSDHRQGSDVPAWFLDTDYNGLCFHVCQAFFPRTSAWEGLKRSLQGEFEDTVWAHLSGTVSTPFQAGEHGQVAVKVVDDRGNELMVVKPLSEADG